MVPSELQDEIRESSHSNLSVRRELWGQVKTQAYRAIHYRIDMEYLTVLFDCSQREAYIAKQLHHAEGDEQIILRRLHFSRHQPHLHSDLITLTRFWPQCHGVIAHVWLFERANVAHLPEIYNGVAKSPCKCGCWCEKCRVNASSPFVTSRTPIR